MLGLALLGMPLGSLAAIHVTGRLIARWGSSPVRFAGLLVLSVATVGPSFSTDFATLLPALILFGIGLGLTDTAMNAQAVTVERSYGRPIMSSFHGYASLGALAGALGGAVSAHLDISICTSLPLPPLPLSLRSSSTPGCCRPRPTHIPWSTAQQDHIAHRGPGPWFYQSPF